MDTEENINKVIPILDDMVKEGIVVLSDVNVIKYTHRGGSSQKGFRCLLKIISWQNLYPNYRNDDYFLQKLLHSELIINLPEELASGLRPYFQR
jgi:hypothetical protein